MVAGDLVQLRTRPRTRGECMGREEPCPFVSCRHHLAHEMVQDMHENSAGDIADAVLAMRHTCALDVADDGQQTFTDIGKAIGTSRQGARLVFNRACKRIGADPLYIEKHESMQRDAAARAYIEGDPIHAAAAFGCSVSRLRELALDRFPDEARKVPPMWKARTAEERRQMVERAKEYPNMKAAAEAFGVAPSALYKWARGDAMGQFGGDRKSGRKRK